MIRPPFRRRATLATVGPALGARRNVDRLLNRMVDYPRALRQIVGRGEFDLFHLVDHSYGQLVPALPAGRVVVTCHDLDTFRCLLEPDREPRPRWFRAMVKRSLDGFRQAAAVACVSEATRRAVPAHDLIPEDRLHVVPNGIADGFAPHPDPSADTAADALLGGPPGAAVELLHVGSTIPRKRIDVLLRVFAEVRRAVPGARLIKAGGALTPEQARLADALGVADSIVPTGPVDLAVLAALYRRAALVLQPSEAEGFGLPVAEAMACGAAVLASDLEVLREVGGPAASYAPVADVPSWTTAALSLLDEDRDDPGARTSRRAAGLAQASRFRWSSHVAELIAIYRRVLS